MYLALLGIGTLPKFCPSTLSLVSLPVVPLGKSNTHPFCGNDGRVSTIASVSVHLPKARIRIASRLADTHTHTHTDRQQHPGIVIVTSRIGSHPPCSTLPDLHYERQTLPTRHTTSQHSPPKTCYSRRPTRSPIVATSIHPTNATILTGIISTSLLVALTIAGT